MCDLLPQLGQSLLQLLREPPQRVLNISGVRICVSLAPATVFQPVLAHGQLRYRNPPTTVARAGRDLAAFSSV
jgi:hypothetical protein